MNINNHQFNEEIANDIFDVILEGASPFDFGGGDDGSLRMFSRLKHKRGIGII